MTTTAGNAVFVDANVLVYTTFDHFSWCAPARVRLAALSAGAVRFYTSRQILREFLAATTRPGFMSPMPTTKFLAGTVRDFEKRRFTIVEDDSEVTALLLQLIEEPGARGRQVHDANIAATIWHPDPADPQHNRF